MTSCGRSLSRLVATTWLAIFLAACGMLAPTPARNRPPLPPSEPFVGVAAEDVVADLTAMGFDCWFDPGGDIPPSWNCRTGSQDVGDYFDVRLASGETGPIEGLFAYRQVEGGAEGAVDPAVLDANGTTAFDDVVALIVPDEHLPTAQELHAGVASNYPMELGGGWYLGFDRNSISRTLRIVHASGP